jgi:cytochrome c oxidase assembly protein subunit 15
VHRGLNRFAVFTAAATFFLIVAGGLVTSTQSGLSVPDWPETYGHFMFAFPVEDMVGGIFYEHSHRMIASVVGFLTLVLAVWLWRREERRWVRNLGAAALAAVVVQGVLGGITVLYLLPTPVSVAHATLAQTFFAAVAAIALFTSRWWITHPENPSVPAGPFDRSPAPLAAAAAAMVWVQLILGAVMRHSGAGLAVPDFPLAYGTLLPSLSPGALDAYTRTLIDAGIRIAADGQLQSSQVAVHLLHRYWGIASAVVLLWAAHRLYWSTPARSRHRRIAFIMAGLTIAQIALGAVTVLARKPVDITTAHVATGALLLVVTVQAALHAFRTYGFARLAAAAPAGEGAR